MLVDPEGLIDVVVGGVRVLRVAPEVKVQVEPSTDVTGRNFNRVLKDGLTEIRGNDPFGEDSMGIVVTVPLQKTRDPPWGEGKIKVPEDFPRDGESSVPQPPRPKAAACPIKA
jgi:hypothetical protein